MIASKPIFRILKILLITVFALLVIFSVLFYSHTSFTKNVQHYNYSLPFQKGSGFRVVQGYGGLFSHQHIAALDFAMPVGTAVCAARSGVVYAYKDDSNEGGIFSKYKNKANYIIIQHDDGSFGCYWHLKQNGVLIKSGHVSEGEQIGFSGETGQVIGPHLHFSVKLMLNYEINSFVQTKFKTSDGIILLQTGNSYENPIPIDTFGNIK